MNEPSVFLVRQMYGKLDFKSLLILYPEWASEAMRWSCVIDVSGSIPCRDSLISDLFLHFERGFQGLRPCNVVWVG